VVLLDSRPPPKVLQRQIDSIAAMLTVSANINKLWNGVVPKPLISNPPRSNLKRVDQKHARQGDGVDRHSLSSQEILRL
jgi:hypothetical protein